MKLLAAIVVSMGLAACSSSKAEQPSGNVFGIQLDGNGTRPACQIGVLVQPEVPANQLVQPIAAVMAEALDACASSGLMQELPTALKFATRDGRLVRAGEGNAPTQGQACLVRELESKSAVQALQAKAHQITLEIALNADGPARQ